MVVALARLTHRVLRVGAEFPGGAAQAAAKTLARTAAMLGADVVCAAAGGDEADPVLRRPDRVAAGVERRAAVVAARRSAAECAAQILSRVGAQLTARTAARAATRLPRRTALAVATAFAHCRTTRSAVAAAILTIRRITETCRTRRREADAV